MWGGLSHIRRMYKCRLVVVAGEDGGEVAAEHG